MAEESKANVSALTRGFSELSGWRQVGLIVGAALVIALVVGVALWSQRPTFGKLYGNLTDKDAGMVIEALEQAQVPYEIDQTTGAIRVPSNKVHEIRMKLAAQGLPKGGGMGFELLEKDQGFGTSEFMQKARYQRAMEGELAHTVETIEAVQKARVHLAIPKKSVFIRDRQDPTASVMVQLARGRALERSQVQAIVHIVASSIPSLLPSNVKVVDQAGRLLTADEASTEVEMSGKQFEYTRKVEHDYIKRIEHILQPVVGAEGVRAQVSADLDFTVTERTRESYNPDQTAVRSEQLSEEESKGGAGVSGVPGALTNQPPGGGVAPEVAGTGADSGNSDATKTNASKQVIRNYEVDRTVSHTKLATGTVRRLSVAVVVDDRKGVDEEGKPTRTPLKADELERITSLVKEAVGFNAQRGDSVNVINASFMDAEEEAPPAEVPIWKEPWFWELAKQLLGGLAVLFVIFGVLRPILNSLAQRGAESSALVAEGAGAMEDFGEQGVSLTTQAPAALEGPSNADLQMEAVKGLVAQDPKIVAQTLKNWIAEDV
ncbi:flagellar basal-body MS-ring/collar protein FliF [Endothiovibrio diazotrophicus]